MSKRPASTLPRVTALAALCGLAGCTDSGDLYPHDRPGQLGRGRFEYYCVDDDAACDDGDTRGDFPGAVAIGGKFRLEFSWKNAEDRDEPLPELRPASPSRLALKGEVFTAQAAGFSSVLAVHGNSEVADFINLYVARPDNLRVYRGGVPVSKVAVAEGEELELRAIPRDEDDVPLGGALTYAWSAGDSPRIQLEGGETGRVRVRGLAPGFATLTVKHEGLSESIDVEVTAESVTTGDTSSGTTGDTGDTGDTSSGTTGETTGDTTGDTSSGSTGDTTGDTTGGVL